MSMKWIADRTGRFARRPFYENFEMENECETVVSDFLIETRGEVRYPLSTDDLTLLVEKYCSLDLYADLTTSGDDVEGKTTFKNGSRPKVQIDGRLSADERRENRLRTTLAHEFGHVRLHNILFQDDFGAAPLFRTPKADDQFCKRETIIGAAQADWMEYQAGFVCTALLAPKRKILEIARGLAASGSTIGAGDPLAEQLAAAISSGFQLSLEAARVRLQTSGVVAGRSAQRGLFPS